MTDTVTFFYTVHFVAKCVERGRIIYTALYGHFHLRRKWASEPRLMTVMPRLGARILPRSTMVRYSGESTVISKFSKLIDYRYRPSPGRRSLTATQRCAFVAAASSVPPHELTATEIIQSIKLNKIRAVDVSKHYLERIERYDSELSCYLTVNASEVLHQVSDFSTAFFIFVECS